MFEMAYILIVEDEIPAQRQLLKLLNKYCRASRVEIADSVESCLELLKASTKPDLAFFDVHLGDGDSFEVFDTIQTDFPIVFTTAYSQYALKAFQLNSIHYLLKPIQEDKFKQAIEKYSRLQIPNLLNWQSILANIDSSKAYRSRFLVRFADKLFSIDELEVAYFQSVDKSVVLTHSSGKKYLINFTLEELENELSPKNFFRLNRQILARHNSIAEVFTHLNGKLKVSLIPTCKEEVFVSRDRANLFKSWLGEK